MPPWVSRMLNSLIFDFFWKTKCELVSRAVVVQPPSLGGFSVVNVKLKVSSLLSQWVRRFAGNPSGWTLLMTYWFLSCFVTSPSVVPARPHSFNHSILPAFYSSLLLAWRSHDGSFLAFFASFRVQRSSCPQSRGGFIFKNRISFLA